MNFDKVLRLADLPQSIAHDLRKRRFFVSDDQESTIAKAFDEYCNWNGLIGYGPRLRAVLDAMEFAAAKRNQVSP